MNYSRKIELSIHILANQNMNHRTSIHYNIVIITNLNRKINLLKKGETNFQLIIPIALKCVSKKGHSDLADAFYPRCSKTASI